MPFKAFELALTTIRSLEKPLAAISHRDPDLARQIRRAAASIALNLSEGNRRQGRDRNQLWHVAAGSADEVRAALTVAEAFRYVDASSIAAAVGHCDHLLAIIRKLTR